MLCSLNKCLWSVHHPPGITDDNAKHLPVTRSDCALAARPTVPNGPGTTQAAAGIQFFKQTAACQSLPGRQGRSQGRRAVGALHPQPPYPGGGRSDFVHVGCPGLGRGAVQHPPPFHSIHTVPSRSPGQAGGGDRSRQAFLTEKRRRGAHHEAASPEAAQAGPRTPTGEPSPRSLGAPKSHAGRGHSTSSA